MRSRQRKSPLEPQYDASKDKRNSHYQLPFLGYFWKKSRQQPPRCCQPFVRLLRIVNHGLFGRRANGNARLIFISMILGFLVLPWLLHSRLVAVVPPTKHITATAEKELVMSRRMEEFAYETLKDHKQLFKSSTQREGRFPSFEQRLKVYTAHWYLPPCHTDNQNEVSLYHMFQYGKFRRVQIVAPLSTRVWTLRTETRAGIPMLIDEKYMMDKNVLEKDLHVEENFMETLRNINPHWDALDKEEQRSAPLLVRFGDTIHSLINKKSAMFPFLTKARPAMEEDFLNAVTSGTCSTPEQRGQEPFPIVHMLGETKHWKPVYEVDRANAQWEDLIPKAVFRGSSTGTRHPDPRVSTFDFKRQVLLEGADLSSTPERFCKFRPRCQLVRRYRNSTLIDARLVHKEGQNQRGYFPELYGDKMELKDQLKYKAIIVVEGNDISTTLKWALYSNSVVMMSKPTVTSWAMEELLVPWQHYVPLDPKLTDVEEQMQWILDNDDKAREIAQNGRNYIDDLLFHDDAREENERLKKEILRRMRAHFMSVPEPLAELPYVSQ